MLDAMPPAAREEHIKAIAIGRAGRPQEVASVVASSPPTPPATSPGR
jgi:hypothetical protein